MSLKVQQLSVFNLAMKSMNTGNFSHFNIPSRRKTSKKTPINAEMRIIWGALGVVLLAHPRFMCSIMKGKGYRTFERSKMAFIMLHNLTQNIVYESIKRVFHRFKRSLISVIDNNVILLRLDLEKYNNLRSESTLVLTLLWLSFCCL